MFFLVDFFSPIFNLNVILNGFLDRFCVGNLRKAVSAHNPIALMHDE